MAELISGKTLAAKLKAEAAAEAAELREKGVPRRLAVVIVGENPASRTYVAGKAKTAPNAACCPTSSRCRKKPPRPRFWKKSRR